MAATATLNIRLDSELKEAGNKILEEHGITTTEAVRALYSYMAEKQELPAFLTEIEEAAEAEEKARQWNSGIIKGSKYKVN